MQIKEIIDDHFQSNYFYYKRVCFKYFKGRYLFEDLLHESYVKFHSTKEETVIRLNSAGKLHYGVLRIIGKLFKRRKTACNRQSRFYEGNNNSSPLFETPGVSYEYDFPTNDVDYDKDEIEIQQYFEKATRIIEDTLQQPNENKKGKSNYLKVKVFLEVQRTNINQISKTTGISRPFITQTYRESQQYLREQILK